MKKITPYLVEGERSMNTVAGFGVKVWPLLHAVFFLKFDKLNNCLLSESEVYTCNNVYLWRGGTHAIIACFSELRQQTDSLTNFLQTNNK